MPMNVHPVPMNPTNQPKYNQIFDKLVSIYPDQSSERLIGMIAYAEYKRDKAEWMQSKPTASKIEMEAFLRSYNDRKLNEYRERASSLLLQYAAAYSKNKLEETLEAEKSKQLIQEIRGAKNSYWSGIGQGVVASFIFSFLLFVIGVLFTIQSPNSGIG